MAEILLGRLEGPSGFERVVVIKRILPHLARTSHFVDMFLDEARIVARIRHPNVVQVHELGRERGELFLVMEYLDGESVGGLLRRLATRDQQLDLALGLHIIAEACAGLHAAHELTDAEGRSLDLVHRDISPQNVFVTYTGQVKLLDFGIAQAADRIARTEAGHVKGKFEYMSPEQCMGLPLDRTSDIFSIGIVLYELLTGRRLFKRATTHLALQAICEEPIVPPSLVRAAIPETLDAICLKALARDPRDRHANAALLRRDLIVAARDLGLAPAPDEALASVMHEIFGDRVAEKRELLRKAKAGSNVTSVPSADADVDVELPSVEITMPAALISSRTPVDQDAPTITEAMSPAIDRRGGGRRFPTKWIAALAGLLVVAVGGLVVIRQLRTVEAPPEPLVAAPSASAVASVTPVAEDASSPAPREVTLRIDTTPRGATVLLDAEERGPTPAEVRLPAAETAMTLELRLPGHQTLKETITPDVDQRLHYSLVASKRAVPHSGGAAKVPPKPSATPPASASARVFNLIP